MMTRKIIITLCLLLLALAFYFRRGQVKQIIQSVGGDKETVEMVVERLEPLVAVRLKDDLAKVGWATFPQKIQLLAFKEERILEVLAQKGDQWYLLKTYPFTAYSGELGPKLKEGDRQIPEGIYQIDFLNPNSAYHLSMRVNYPNSFDRQKAEMNDRDQLGGDIFIHGKQVTIGCIPIGDEAIEELFVLAAQAIDQGIELIISPRDFRKGRVFPEVAQINWEEELYEKILIALPSNL